MSDTTPARSMPTPSPDMSVSDYRLMMVENECRQSVRELKKLNEAIQEWRASDRMEMALAVERCSSHAVMIRDLELKFKEHASDESTAVIRIVTQEIDRREFQASKDTPARWGAAASLVLSIIGILAAAKAWLGGAP